MPAIGITPGDATTASMGRRVLAGSLWLFLLKIFKQVVFLGRAIVLARLLTPRDFGLVGIGELAILLLGVLTYTGVGEALVAKPKPSASFVHTAWWVNLGRSAFIALALFFLAPWLAAQFQEPAAAAIIRVLALSQFLAGFISMGVSLLWKEMQFRQLCKFEAWGMVADLMVALAVAFWWRSVWALVLGTLAGIAARVVASYLLYPGRPQFTFDFQAARELFGFGQWVLLSGLAYFLLSRSTESLSGLCFGAAALGLYQMAARFAFIPVNHFGEVFQGALFPALSMIQEDSEKLRKVFLTGLQAATLIILPLSLLIGMVLAPLLPYVLGSKWEGVVALLQVLALAGAVQALLRTGLPLFLALGRPDCQFLLDLAAAVGIGLLIFPLSRLLGLQGLAWAYALGIFLGVPVWWRFVRNQCRVSSRELLISLSAPLSATAVMAAAIWLPLQFWPGAAGVLVVLGAVSLVLYLGSILLWERYLPGFQPLGSLLGLIFPVAVNAEAPSKFGGQEPAFKG